MNFFRALLLLFALCSASYARELPEPVLPYIRYEAQDASYNLKDESIHLSGNVRLYEHLTSSETPSRVFKGDEFFIYPASSTVVSKGRVFAEEGLDAFYAEDLQLNWETNEGHFINAEAWYGNWRIIKSSTAVVSDGKYTYDKVYVTSCDEDKPHYKIYMGHMNMIPNRRFYGTNALVYLNDIPILWLPFIYKRLGTDSPFITYVTPGYDNRNGFGVQTTTVYKMNDHFTSKLFLDYFTNINFGGGLGLNYHNPDVGTGSISTYAINEPGKGNERWGVTGGYWLELINNRLKGGALYYTQAQARMVSDPDFNNDFFRSSPYAVSPDENISAAIVRQSRYTTTRVSYEQLRVKDEDINDFRKTKELLPSVTFNTTSFSLPFLGPRILNSITADFANRKTEDRYFFEPQGNAQWRMNTSLNLISGVLSFVPEAFYRQSVVFPTDEGYDETRWTGRLGGSGNFRIYSPLGSTDIGYAYTSRSAANKLTADTGANDRGTENSQINFAQYISPNIHSYFLISTAYDLRDLRSGPRGFSERLDPININFVYTGFKKWTFTLNEQFKTGEGNKSIGFYGSYGEIGNEEPSVGLGFTNDSENTEHYYLTANLGLFPKNASWGVEALLGLDCVVKPGFNFDTISLFRKEFTLYKNFHDFRTMWTVKFRPGVQAFSFKISLRFNERNQRSSLAGERRMDYPWRVDNASVLDM